MDASPTLNVPAAVLNNSAVAYLQAGRPAEAMELLQIGLSHLRDQFVEKRGRQLEQAPSRDQDDDDDAMVEEYNLPYKPTYVSAVSSIPVFWQQDVSSLTLYDRALLVDTALEGDEILSSVILYNMGLLHHNRGLESGVSNFLHRGYRLYQISLDILTRQNSASDPLLLMALFNNMAHVASNLFQVNEMRAALGHIRTILSGMGHRPQLDEDDYAIFYANTFMFGQREEFMVAPAA
jgi:hypothetical protein